MPSDVARYFSYIFQKDSIKSKVLYKYNNSHKEPPYSFSLG